MAERKVPRILSVLLLLSARSLVALAHSNLYLGMLILGVLLKELRGFSMWWDRG